MQAPGGRIFRVRPGDQGVHARDQPVFRAKVSAVFRRPGTPRLPCETKGLRPDLLKETGKILNVRAVRPERRGTLEKNHTGPNRIGYFKCLHPRLPDLVGILKRPEERASFGIDRPSQAAIGWTRRLMSDQLPGFHRKLKSRGSDRPPSRCDFRVWRVIERGLDFDDGKLRNILRLGASPAATAGQRQKLIIHLKHVTGIFGFGSTCAARIAAAGSESRETLQEAFTMAA